MRKIAPAIVIAGIILVIGILSKPDRGGVERCSRVFSIPELEDIGLTHKPFIMWDLFESAKFRFAISKKGFEELSAELKRRGYSEWERGGVTFGSVDVGWNADEDNVYCKSTERGYDLFWSYSEKDNLIYAITFPD